MEKSALKQGQTLGERIRILRIGLGLNQQDLTKPGLPVQVIELIETDQCDPPGEWLGHLAQVLGVNAGWLTGTDETRLRNVAEGLAASGVEMLDAGNIKDAAEILQQTSDFARNYGWRDLEAQIAVDLSRALQMNGQVHSAVDYSLRSLLSLPSRTDVKSRLKMLILTGNALYTASNFAQASLLYDAVMQEAPDDSVTRVKMLLNKALCQLNMGNFDKARQTLSEAEEIAQSLQDPRWLAWAFIDLAVCDLGQRQALPRVRGYLDKAQQFALEAQDPAAYASAIHDQGEYCLYQKQWAEAEKYFSEALSYLQDDNAAYVFILDDLAELYIHRRYWRKAARVIQQMFRVAIKVDSPRIDGLAFRRRMQWHLGREERDKAHDNFVFALNAFNEAEHSFEIRQTLKMWESHPSWPRDGNPN